jgi:sulfate permease, SulP family
VRAVVVDAEAIPFIDVSAAGMLDALAADLAAAGVRLLLARDVGQVRDVLSKVAGRSIEMYPSVREAVDAAARLVSGEASAAPRRA